MAKVVILGAGLTGLSVAYHLEQNNFSDYLIFEQQEKPGGLLRSFKQDGFTFDFTGHLLHSNNDYFTSFLQTVVGQENFNQVTRRAAIYSHNTYADYPFQMNLRNLPFDIMYECIDGFIKRNQSRNVPKNFHEWVLKHFGVGIGKHFFFPYNSKLLAYPIKKITPSWTGRFVPQTNLKAILQGALHDPSRNVGYNSSFLYPKTDGIEFIIKKLLGTLKNNIQVQHQAASIDVKNKIIFFTNGHKEHYETLVTTMPLDKLLDRMALPSHLSFKTAQQHLICNSVININLGFDKTAISDKHWIYFPEKAYPFYRLGFWNNINPTSVKPGCSAIYGEISYLPKANNKNIIKRKTAEAISASLKFLNLEPNNIVTEKILHLDHAYVIYNTWREKNLHKLIKQLNQEHIFSVGRFGAWKYSSMQEAILEGKDTAETILIKETKNTIKKVNPATTYRQDHKQATRNIYLSEK